MRALVLCISRCDDALLQAPPIGLIHTAWGGSTIEQWLDNTTISTCRNATLSPTNQEWHDTRIVPYVDMTIKGWVWYQGENDMGGVFGNSVSISQHQSASPFCWHS